MTASEIRIMIVKALAESWTEMVENPNCMIRAFDRTGISLKTDGEDETKMQFQSQKVGIPAGLEI